MANRQEYRAGTLSTSQMKEACIEKLQGIVAEFQAVSVVVSEGEHAELRPETSGCHAGDFG